MPIEGSEGSSDAAIHPLPDGRPLTQDLEENEQGKSREVEPTVDVDGLTGYIRPGF